MKNLRLRFPSADADSTVTSSQISGSLHLVVRESLSFKVILLSSQMYNFHLNPLSLVAREGNALSQLENI